MSLDSAILKIQWDCTNPNRIKKSRILIGVGTLLLGILIIVIRSLSSIDYSIPFGPDRPYRDPLGYAITCFGFSIFQLYKHFKIPQRNRQLLKNKNIYSIMLNNDFIIYSENFIDKVIYYKNIKKISYYEDKNISVRYTYSIASANGLGRLANSEREDYFHIPLVAIEASKLNVKDFLKIFQKKIREYNPQAELID